VTWSWWQAAVVQAEGKKRLLLGVSQYMGIAIQTKQKKSGDTRADHAVHSESGVDLPNKTGGQAGLNWQQQHSDNAALSSNRQAELERRGRCSGVGEMSENRFMMCC